MASYAAWCRTTGRESLPALPDTVALYRAPFQADLGLKTSTIRRPLTAISQAHKTAGHEAPTRAAAVHLVSRPAGTARHSRLT